MAEEKTRVTMLLAMGDFQNPENVTYLKNMLEKTGYEVGVNSIEAYMARGRVPDCTCELIQCVCAEARKHEKGCRFRQAMTCAVAITCDHGVDVCPECDPCTCAGVSPAP